MTQPQIKYWKRFIW